MEPIIGASTILTIAIVCLSVLCTLVITAVAIAIPFYMMRNNQKKLKDLAATGIQGQATVLQLEDTGMRINDDPRVAVTLQVELPGYAPYVVRKTVTLPLIRMSQVQVGSVIIVLADPAFPGNPDKVALMLR